MQGPGLEKPHWTPEAEGQRDRIPFGTPGTKRGWAVSWQPVRLLACARPFQTNKWSDCQSRMHPSPGPCWGKSSSLGLHWGQQAVAGCHSPCSLPGRPAQRPEPSPPEPEPHAPEKSQAGAEGPPSPEASRSPARGAYLQSLEPSSRRWVLGGAKPPEEAALGPRAPGSGEPAGEIWYNPIPEEDSRPLAPEPPGPQPGSAEPEGPASQGEHKPQTSGPPKMTTSLTPVPSPGF